MTEIFHESIRVINFPFTVLFGLSLLYWVAALFGAMDFEFLDFDFDLDMDADNPGMFGKLGHYLHFGDTPSFVILSLLFVFMWGFSMTSNYYFNSEDSLLRYLVLIFLMSPFDITFLYRRTRNRFLNLLQT